MTAPTPEQIIALIVKFEADIPKLKKFLVTIASKPVLTGIAVKLWPELAVILPHLSDLAPFIDFLDDLAKEVLALTSAA